MSAYDTITGFLPSFFYRQLFITPNYPTTDCTGKTIIVTGANTGLGLEAARQFVRLNASKVIITSRNADKGAAAKRDIEATTNRNDVVEVWALDLQDYDSVRAFAKRAQGLKRIDIVIENAGISTKKFYAVKGVESTVLVNVISTFLLALLLLPKLQEVAKVYDFTPTLTIVSSEVHFVTSFQEREASSIWATLNNEKEARIGERYPVSKMLEVLACREIAREHPVSQLGVTLNFVNPGWCYSELMREVDQGVILRAIMRAVCRTQEVGSRVLVAAGLAGPETHGKYISDCVVSRCAPLVEGPEGPGMQRRWWKELSDQLELIEPGVTKVLDR